MKGLKEKIDLREREEFYKLYDSFKNENKFDDFYTIWLEQGLGKNIEKMLDYSYSYRNEKIGLMTENEIFERLKSL